MDELEAFKYCLRCGQEAKKKSGMLDCPNCGLHYYINARPCTTTIIQTKDYKYLLVRRKIEPGKGLWDLPGGFIDPGESMEDGARREVREELGIEVTNLRYLESYTDRYEYQGVNYHTLAANFLADLPEGAEPKPADDVSDFAFFTLKEIPYDELAFPSLHEPFKLLRELLNVE